MPNPLKHGLEVNSCSEASHVVRTAVVVEGQTDRIEVLKRYVPSTAPIPGAAGWNRP
jgi:hypothetical protein